MKYNPKSKKIDEFEGFSVTKANIFNQVSDRFQWLPYTQIEIFLRDFKHPYKPHKSIHTDLRYRIVSGSIVIYHGNYYGFTIPLNPENISLLHRRKQVFTQIFPSIH